MKYIIKYQPNRSNFVESMTEVEFAKVGEHFEYLKKKFADGQVVFAGRRDDGDFGIAVFEAESDAEARSFLESDPVVRSGVFSATVGSFRLALATDARLMG